MLKLQSVAHDKWDGGAICHTWWCKCRVQFPLLHLGLSHITVLADVNALLGMPSIVAECSCSCYATLSFMIAYLYTGYCSPEVQINSLLTSLIMDLSFIGYEPSSPI